MELRQGVSGQTAAQVKSVAVLRHNVLHLYAVETTIEHEVVPLNAFVSQ